MKRQIRKRDLPGTTSAAVQDYERTHAALARTAAAEGIVLLKNDQHFLPLSPDHPVALYGAGVSKTIKGGTGSGDVNERHSVAIFEGMKAAGFPITNKDWIQRYESVYQAARQEWKNRVLAKNATGSGAGLDFFLAYASTPFYLPTGPEATKTEADTAIFVISRIAGEGADRYAEGGDYYLSEEEQELLRSVCSLYKNVVVIINAGGVIDLSFMDEYNNIRALLFVAQPGMEGGNAIADILTGKVTPSGKLTDTWAYRYEDYPNARTFSHNNGNVDKEYYQEGIYVGYRYFDSFEVPVRYGFGFGMSYTRFALETLRLTVDDQGEVTVSVRVTNIGGTYSGKEVVQVYAALPDGRLEKEYRRLCAFAKTGELAPGDAQTLTLSFSTQDLACFDEEQSAWVLEQGVYGIYVGSSLNESRIAGALSLEQDKLLTHTEHICPMQEPCSELRRSQALRAKQYRKLVEEAQSIRNILAYDLSSVAEQKIDYSIDLTEQDEAYEIVRTLSTEQLIHLSTGDPGKGQGSALGSAGVTVPGSAGETSSCALKQGIANIVLADGPAGLRLNQHYYVKDGQPQMLPFEASLEKGFFFEGEEPDGEKVYQYCTAIPVGTLLAQSWDMPLLETIGSMVGEEMERFGITLWLAPGMNLHRNPLCGRNFEYYSEDPLLSGKAAAAITKGVQSHPGCGTTIKHFACNNQEDNRMASDSVVSERALRELYLRSFGIAIEKSQPFAIMTSYNLINGIHTANSYDLCTKAARCEFGFRGMIVTDWTTTEQGPDCTAAGCIRAGNDLIMPGQPSDHENIRQALADHTLSEDELRLSISRLVRLILQADVYTD